MSDLFEFGELELSQKVGVAVRHFQTHRAKKMRQGVNWDLAGLRVAYSKNGLALAVKAVTGDAPDATTLALLEKAARLNASNSSVEVEAKLTRLFMNPRLIEVTLPDQAKVRVKVKETKNLRVGMLVPVRPNVQTSQYELARKLPRFPGRW